MGTRYRVMPFVMVKHRFADDINAKIVAGKLTQAEVAATAGISETSVSMCRRALLDNVLVSTFLGICNALDLDPRDYWELES